MVYLLSEGIKPFDENYDPVFKDDPATIAVFEWWQAMFQDGLTTETMLTDQPPQLLTSVQEGNAAFFTLHHYFLKSHPRRQGHAIREHRARRLDARQDRRHVPDGRGDPDGRRAVLRCRPPGS